MSLPHFKQYLLPLSAKSRPALRTLAARVLTALKETPKPLADLCFTASCGRDHFPHRLALLGADAPSLISALEAWLEENAKLDTEGVCRTRADNKVVRACVPMHTFGHPADLDGLISVTHRWNISLVEDAAESLGSFYKGKHTGTFGTLGTLSFNGNKIMTTGGGGMILAGGALAARAKHLTTTAKKPHAYEYIHDELGYNYRLPNLNAALGCAQLEQLETFIGAKRALAAAYEDFFSGTNQEFVREPADCRSNYWLNAVICEDKAHRDELLHTTNSQGVMTRPVWTLMNHLAMYRGSRRGALSNAEWLESRVVNLPSSVVVE